MAVPWPAADTACREAAGHRPTWLLAAEPYRCLLLEVQLELAFQPWLQSQRGLQSNIHQARQLPAGRGLTKFVALQTQLSFALACGSQQRCP